MNKHFIANKYLPIALALAAFAVAGTAPVLAQSTKNAQPIVHDVLRPDPFGENKWFNR